MLISGVSTSQQTGAPTLLAQEQSQGSTSQRRTSDTIEGKDGSSSCSFRCCFTRICDFFCALIRCLFCIKDKPAKPNAEQKQQSEKPAQSTRTKTEESSKPLPIDEAYVFWGTTSIEKLKQEATKLAFKELSPEAQSSFLEFILRPLDRPMYQEYLKINKTLIAAPPSKVEQTQLPAPTKTQQPEEPPKPELLNLGKAALHFVSNYANALELEKVETKAEFGLHACETREQILVFIKINAKTMYATYEEIHKTMLQCEIVPVEPLKPKPLILNPDANHFVFTYIDSAIAGSPEQFSAFLEFSRPQSDFRELSPEAREQVLDVIKEKAGTMYEIYNGIHAASLLTEESTA